MQNLHTNACVQTRNARNLNLQKVMRENLNLWKYIKVFYQKSITLFPVKLH